MKYQHQHQHYFCFLVLLVAVLQSAPSCHGFVGFPQSKSRRPALQAVFSTKEPIGKKRESKTTNANTKSNTNTNTSDMLELRADIERMREEAAMRLEALSEKLILVTAASQKKQVAAETTDSESDQQHKNENQDLPIIASLTAPATSSTAHDVGRVNLDDAKTMENLTEIAGAFERDMHLLNQKKDVKAAAAATQKKNHQKQSIDQRHPLKLLDDTRWRMMLNVHRVRGTWMPKTWGASGDHLRMKFEVEFTTEELYEREDFFNGLSDGSKVLRIVHNEATLAPTMTEGGKTIRIVDGGWRVCPNEGPLGTAILRWYFDVEEQASHLGSDIYLPKGRIYGTCGYFPMIGRSNVDGRGTSKRDFYQKELRQMEVKYLSLKGEMDKDTNLVSLDKFKRFQEMREVRQEAHKVKRTIDEEIVKEPTKDTLRLSRDQTVGLTHEGGICCKKQNGLAQEYHILGKFELGSIDNRDHSDYRELLRP
jgi:hypothetical protein